MLVYECRPSYEDDRPEIDFQHRKNRSNGWLTVAEVTDGDRPVKDYPTVEVLVAHPEATQWDSYNDSGGRGLFSQKFVDTVGLASFRGLSLLPAKLNGVTYYFLRCEEPVNCFDRANSIFVTFPSDPAAIMDITHWAFRRESLPDDALFVLPEVPDLLATESVVRRIRVAKLKGLNLQPLP